MKKAQEDVRAALYRDGERPCIVAHQDGMLSAVAAAKAAALQNAQGTQSSVYLKLIGFTGQTKQEAHKKYLDVRAQLIRHNYEVASAKAAKSRMFPETMMVVTDVTGENVSDPQIKALVDRSKLLDAQVKHARQAMHETLSNATEMKEDWSEGPSFPLPDMDPAPFAKRRAHLSALQEWTRHPAVITRYPFPVNEIRYMLDAIDPKECCHTQPPDLDEEWRENPLNDKEIEGVPDSLVKIAVSWYNKARDKQWALILQQIKSAAEGTQKRSWITTLHTVGQYAKKSVDIENDGRKLVLVMLSQLVDFDADKQRQASEQLHKLGDLWNQKKPKESIEAIRATLVTAAGMGVVPSYQVMARPLFTKVPEHSHGMQQALHLQDLTSETIENNKRFDAYDCSLVILDMMAVAQKVISDLHQGDSASGKARYHALEASVLKSPTKPQKGTLEAKMVHHIRQCNIPEDEAPAAEALLAKVLHTDEHTDVVGHVVQAFSLKLESGTRLSEPQARSAIANFKRLKGGGKKGGKAYGGKQGGKKGGKAGSPKGGKSGRGPYGRAYNPSSGEDASETTQMCEVTDCKNTVTWNSNLGKYNPKCTPCFQNRTRPNKRKADQLQANEAEAIPAAGSHTLRIGDQSQQISDETLKAFRAVAVASQEGTNVVLGSVQSRADNISDQDALSVLMGTNNHN